MDLHGTHPSGLSKEIRCADCGHQYRVSIGQQSSHCANCGNVAFHAVSPVAEISRAILQKNVLPLLTPRQDTEPTPSRSPLDAFQGAPDGHRVEEILMNYQVEWQLWAMVVKNFNDPAFHSAYLTNVISRGTFAEAAERYREHRSVMVLAKDSHWQAQVADLMLERIQALSAMRMEMAEKPGFRFPEWIRLLPFDSRVMRFGWIILGLFLAARAFRVL